MTDIDTSPEAVNWVALTIETAARLVALQSPTSAAAIDEAAALLRQLAKEKAERDDALRGLEAALRKDSRDKTISGDTVEYHLDGQAMYRAINKVRALITSETAGSDTSSA